MTSDSSRRSKSGVFQLSPDLSLGELRKGRKRSYYGQNPDIGDPEEIFLEFEHSLSAIVRFPVLAYLTLPPNAAYLIPVIRFLRPTNPNVTTLKLRLVARYIDILLARRIWNFRSTAYSTMQYVMFLLTRDIRGLAPRQLAQRLVDGLEKQEENFDSNDLYVHQQNRYAVLRLLPRMTDYVETQSGSSSRYVDYVWETGKKRYEIEHIWANKPERHREEFPDPRDFAQYRNLFGGLLLLPKSFNASYGDLTFRIHHDHGWFPRVIRTGPAADPRLLRIEVPWSPGVG